MFKKLQAFFVRTVERVENNSTPFRRYYFLFAAILLVRLALEFFSSRRLFTLDDILHIGLWFTFIVLAFLVQLHLFSGEKIMKVAKLVIVFFSIALTAPIIDLLLTKGVGAKMNYLSLRSWKDVLWSYITIGGSSFSRGATLGIRIEIVLLVIASFNYVRTKRNSIALGILAALCIYTILFFSGAVPLILGSIIETLHLQYQPDDRSTLLLLLTLDIFIFCFALLLYSPKRIYAILAAAPWLAIMLALAHAVFGAWLALKNYPSNWTFNPTSLFWFPLLLVLALCFAGYAGTQRLQARSKNNNEYDLVKKGLVLLILIISCMISVRTFFTSALLWGLLFLLNEPPLELRKVPVLRNLLWAMAFLAAAFIGFCTFGAPMIGFPALWMMGILGGIFIAGFFVSPKKNVPD